MSINAQPFNPTFKLTGNLQQDQVLVYDVSENAFVNATGSGTGGVSSSIDAVSNTGTGLQLADIVGTTLEIKTLIGGDNITITDNGAALVLNASFEESIQSGTNLGLGSGLYSGVDGSTNQLRFKSIRVMGDLNLADDGETITITYTGAGGGSTDPSANLSDLTDIGVARTNLAVISEAESDARYLRLDAHSLPTQNNMWDIGSPEHRFNDVYGETFQGTAVLSDNLTISGGEGDVLTRIGSTWVARPASQAQIDLSDYATTDDLNTAIAGIQHPAIPADVSDLTDTTGLLGGSTGDHYTDADNQNYLGRIEGSIIPNTNLGADLGTLDKRFGELFLSSNSIYLGDNHLSVDDTNDFKIEHGGVLTNLIANHYHFGLDKKKLSVNENTGFKLRFTNDATTQNYGFDLNANDIGDLRNVAADAPTNGQALVWNGSREEWIPGTVATTGGVSSWNDLTDKPVLFDGAYTSLTDTPVLFDGAYASLTDTPVLFDGAYASLTGAPTIPDVSAFIGEAAIDAKITSAVSGGSVDLSAYYTRTEVDGLIPSVFSGDYADLTNKPTIPSLDGLATQAWVIDQGFLTTDNDNQGLILTGSVLTITGSTTSIDLSTIIPTVPTVVSALTNDAGYITSADVFSGDYNDLTNTPTGAIISTLSDLSNVSDNTPADGQHLVFDSATGQWKPSHASSGSETGYGDADARNALSSGVGVSYNSSTGRFALNAQLNDLLDVDTSGITNGQVLKWNGASFVAGDDTVLTSTDQLAEGTSNLWYSDDRVQNVLNDLDTDDIAEGVNLYFTSDRVNAILDTNIVAGTGINIVTGTDNVKTISATVSSLDFNNITNTPTTLAGYGITDNVQGPQGETGPQGEQGIQGNAGADSTVAGPQGDQGVQGVQGVAGPKGDTGDTGPQGDQGQAGAASTVPGPQGVAGPAGADSTVAGPKGDTGDTGPQGIQGETGATGADSTVAGPQGLTGPQGDQGVQGVQGEQGPAGQDGASGTTDYNALTNKPTIPSDVNDLTDADGLLGGGGSSITSINELNDVNTAGIQNGQFLSWDGTRFVATAQSAADLTQETLSELGDVATDSPVSGDSLVWNGSAWAPQAVSSGSGGSGTTAEYFKLNYSTSGALESITNTTSGVSATILSATGGDIEITFSGYTFPPAGVLIYGYSRATNEYNMTPLNKDITTRKISGGGSSGSPTAFGAMGNLTLTLKLREAESGASRSFGTPTHAWVMFTMI